MKVQALLVFSLSWLLVASTSALAQEQDQAVALDHAQEDALMAEVERVTAEAAMPVHAETESATSETTSTTPASSVAQTEAEIPVLTKVKTAEKSGPSPTSRLVLSLLIVLAAAGGLLAFAKFWARRRSGRPQHTQIKVVTHYALGPKKSLAIVRVAGESILIGVTDHNISLIKDLSLMDEEAPQEIAPQFHRELNKAETRAETKAILPAKAASEGVDDEDFSYGSVRDMVASKIRELRSL